MKKLFVIFLCVTTFMGVSQEEGKKSGVGFYVYGGVQIPELNNLDALLSANNYAPIANEHFSGGFALYKEFGKIVSTVEVFAYNRQRESLGNFSSLRVFSGSLSVGYNLFSSSEKYAFIPSLALNVYQATIKTSIAPTANVDYPTFISTGNQEEINGIGMGVSANVTALISPFEKWKSFHFGIRAGYNLTTTLDWKTVNGHSVNNVPDMEPLGANVSLLVGLKF